LHSLEITLSLVSQELPESKIDDLPVCGDGAVVRTLLQVGWSCSMWERGPTHELGGAAACSVVGRVCTARLEGLPLPNAHAYARDKGEGRLFAQPHGRKLKHKVLASHHQLIWLERFSYVHNIDFTSLFLCSCGVRVQNSVTMF